MRPIAAVWTVLFAFLLALEAGAPPRRPGEGRTPRGEEEARGPDMAPGIGELEPFRDGEIPDLWDFLSGSFRPGRSVSDWFGRGPQIDITARNRSNPFLLVIPEESAGPVADPLEVLDRAAQEIAAARQSLADRRYVEALSIAEGARRRLTPLLLGGRVPEEDEIRAEGLMAQADQVMEAARRAIDEHEHVRAAVEAQEGELRVIRGLLAGRRFQEAGERVDAVLQALFPLRRQAALPDDLREGIERQYTEAWTLRGDIERGLLEVFQEQNAQVRTLLERERVGRAELVAAMQSLMQMNERLGRFTPQVPAVQAEVASVREEMTGLRSDVENRILKTFVDEIAGMQSVINQGMFEDAAPRYVQLMESLRGVPFRPELSIRVEEVRHNAQETLLSGAEGAVGRIREAIARGSFSDATGRAQRLIDALERVNLVGEAIGRKELILNQARYFGRKAELLRLSQIVDQRMRASRPDEALMLIEEILSGLAELPPPPDAAERAWRARFEEGLGGLQRTARARMQLDEYPIEVGTIVFRTEAARRFAWVNGRFRAEGDRITPEGPEEPDIRIRTILPEGVVFEFEGQTRTERPDAEETSEGGNE